MTCGTSRGVREINDGHDLRNLSWTNCKNVHCEVPQVMAFIKTLVPGEKKPEGMIKIEGESEFRRPEGASGTGRDDHNRGEEASWFIRRESQKSERDCRNLSDK